MKNLLTLGGLAASLFMISCENTDTDENIGAQDREFVNQITLSNRSEIALGNLALAMATDPSVRSYAQMMVADHTAAENDLKQITNDLGLGMPMDSLTPMAQMTRMQLMSLTGTQFDSAYIVSQVPMHDSSRIIVQTQANTGANGPLRNYATMLLPKIEMHRNMADTMATRFR
jgi:putative membrane protein